jgi:beta-lactamase class D
MKAKIFIIACLTALSSYAQFSIKEISLDEHFRNMEGTFIILDTASGVLLVHNKERMEQSFLPASTFKIPNTVIGLEEGIISDDNIKTEWDSLDVQWKPRWPETWKQGQTLESAFRNSVVWYYQSLAKKIGPDRMIKYLEKFNYGNKDISEGIDHFWLSGTFRISPVEQVMFLKRLFNGEFGISGGTLQILTRIMELKRSDGYVIYGKTGTAALTDKRYLAWLTGFIESSGKRYYYALNIEGDNVWEEWPPQKRVNLIENILAEDILK